MEDGFDSDEPLTDPGLVSDGAVPTFGDGGVDSTKATPFDTLPWRKVELPRVTGDAWGLDADGGLLELDELDGRDWERHVASSRGKQEGEQVEAGQRDKQDKEKRKQAKKERMALARLERSRQKVVADEGVKAGSSKADGGKGEGLDREDLDGDGFEEVKMARWGGLATPVLRSLHALGFTSPTPVQEATLEAALADRDVIAVAQTGSGKTLAYALPIVHSMLSRPWRSEASTDAIPLAALVLTPTRELCLQVANHIERLLAPKGKNRSGTPVVAVCGGIAAVKQRSRLERASKLCADLRRGTVMVATPGRLWDLAQTWDELARGIRNVRWLVVDEADRMTEKGRFDEAQRIVDLTRRRPNPSPGDWQDEAQDEGRADLQTMVFSATMDAALQKDVRKRTRRNETALDRLMDALDFRDPEPVLIDLTPTNGVVSGLTECKIECLVKEKDVHLYHFLLRYPGRTLVFVSSIAALRRLAPLLSLLLPTVVTLHSSMPQRQRLKNLDRFRSDDAAVLLATDVAARGLDVPEVQHVVHFQVPRSADGYVHRSGRTARAGREGVSLVMIGPDEFQAWRALLRQLKKNDDLEEPPFEHSTLDRLRERLELAKSIDELEHSARKSAHDDGWLQKTADAMDVDLDHSDDSTGTSKRASRAAAAQARSLRARLGEMLKRPLVLAGITRGRYLTATDEVVKTLLEGKGHRQMIGLKEGVGAVEEVGKRKRKR